MTEPRRLLIVMTLVVIGAVACSDNRLETTSFDVEIEIEIKGGQRWSISAGASGSGMCTGGSHRWVGYRTADGSPIEYGEAVSLRQAQPAQVLIETQLGCSDGTGAISIAWKPNEHDSWMVVGGSGAYARLTGGGRVEGGDAGPDGPAVLLGELSSG